MIVLADLEHVFRISRHPVRLRRCRTPTSAASSRRWAPRSMTSRACGSRRRSPGLLVQPIIGYMSDRTWNWLGRRRPYFLAGAVLASLALFAMPHSPTLWMAAGMLWVLDASINISMEPFRAFVGGSAAAVATSGRLRDAELLHRRGRGGREPVAVDAGARRREQRGHARISRVPDTVRYSFYIGAVVLLGAILWTVLSTREYPPAELHGFADATPLAEGVEPGSAYRAGAARTRLGGGRRPRRRCWCGATALDRMLYVLGGHVRGVGCAAADQQRSARRAARCSHADRRHRQHAAAHAASSMPVQFFSWLALFAMWIHDHGRRDAACTSARPMPSARPYNEGANWVGVLFGAYNGFAALAAIVIPFMVRRFGHAREPSDQSVAGRRRAAVVPRDSRSAAGCCCRWWAWDSPGRRSCRCPMRCWPTACRRARWACTWASSISSS